MSNFSQMKEETKQKLLKKLPYNLKSLKTAEQNLIIATIMPLILSIPTIIAMMLIMIKQGSFIMAFAYCVPLVLVFLIVFLNGRKRHLKTLNEIIGKCTDGELNYSQYREFIKENLDVKQEIENIFTSIDNSVVEQKTAYNVILEEVPAGAKAEVIQALTSLGCTLEVAKHASETPSTLVFSNLTEEQALKNTETIESFGAKIKIESVEYNGVNEEQKAKTEKIKKNHRIIEIVSIVSIVFMLILFALPIININAIIVEYDCGVFSFVFANKKSCEGLLATLMADFVGVEVENYNNIFAMLGAFNVKNLLSFVSVVSLICVMAVYAFVVIVEIIGLVVELFKGKQNTNTNVSVCESYREKLSSLTAEQLAKKNNATIKLFIMYAIGKIIRIFLTIYFPIRLLLYLAKNPLITISPVVVVLFILAVVVDFGASCIKWWYSAKNPIELDNINYLKKTIK